MTKALKFEYMSAKLKLGRQFRAVSTDGIKLDTESRTLEFPFSSDAPVERWFGTEILSHKSGAADLKRLNDGGALLWNHDTSEVIGVVEGAELRSDGRVWAKTRFAKNAKGEEVMGMVQDGILKNVSFGYQVREMALTKAGKNQPDEYTATKWEPYEVSIVSVPADPSVGIGRADTGEEVFEVPVLNQRNFGGKDMNEEEKKLAAEKAAREQTERTAAEARIRAEARDGERVRLASITALGEKFGNTDLARQLIESDKSIDEARAAFIEKMGVKQVPLTGREAEIGLTEKETKEYSFVRALNAQLYPTDRKIQEAAKFEREASDAAAAKGGKAARGMIVPVDVLRGSKRDLTVGTSTAGGNLVATDLLSGSFIELLRNKSVVQKAGATVMSGLVGNIAIPKQTGAATAYWVAESGSPTESAQTIGQVSMSPKTVGAFNDYSRKLLLQSSIDIETFIRGDLAAVIALELDRVALYGLGSSNQPQGIKAAIAGGNQEKNWAAATPTFAEVIAMETAITSANGDIGSMSYLTNASMRGSLKSAVKVSGYPSFIMESDGSVNGYPAMISNQVASGDMFFGVWSQLIMGFWSGLDLLVDPYTASTSGTVRVVALQDCDIAIRHSESFCRGNDTP